MGGSVKLEPLNRCRRRHLKLTLSSCAGLPRPLGLWLCVGQPAAGSPTGTRRVCWGGLDCRVARRRLTTEKRPWYKQALDEVWHKGYSTTLGLDNTTHTHTDTLGLRNGPVKWPQRCGSLRGARPIGQTDRQTDRWLRPGNAPTSEPTAEAGMVPSVECGLSRRHKILEGFPVAAISVNSKEPR